MALSGWHTWLPLWPSYQCWWGYCVFYLYWSRNLSGCDRPGLACPYYVICYASMTWPKTQGIALHNIGPFHCFLVGFQEIECWTLKHNMKQLKCIADCLGGSSCMPYNIALKSHVHPRAQDVLSAMPSLCDCQVFLPTNKFFVFVAP